MVSGLSRDSQLGSCRIEDQALCLPPAGCPEGWPGVRVGDLKASSVWAGVQDIWGTGMRGCPLLILLPLERAELHPAHTTSQVLVRPGVSETPGVG